MVLALTGCATAPTSSSPLTLTAPSTSPTAPARPAVSQTAPQRLPPSTPLPTSSPTLTSLPTPAVTAPPDWAGEWVVYLSSPVLSIVKTVRFQLPSGTDTSIRAAWTEGTRPVSFDGVLSEDRRTITGIFYNSDVDVYEFTITLYPDGLQFSGPMLGEAGAGSFCGARAALPKPNPCGKLPP